VTATADQPTADETPESRTGGLLGAAVVVALLALLGFVNSTMVLVVLVIAFVVFMHELGHYLTARWTGMKATEFFLGFGPRIFSFRRGETDFGLKPILLGAYVKIIGMHNLDDVDASEENRTYRQQSYPRRILVASAGSLMHFAMAIVGLFVFLMVWGSPVIPDRDAWEVRDAPAAFRDGSPAFAGSSGVQAGDRILTIEGQSALEWGDFVEVVVANPGETVELVIERDGQELTLVVPVVVNPETGGGRIGIGAAQGAADYEDVGILGAAGSSFTTFFDMSWDALAAMGQIFSNLGELADRIVSPPNDPTANDNLETRPLSLVGAVQVGARDNLTREDRLRLFIGFNIFIGIFNLLPLLPLDGGHIAVATYERIREGRSGRRHMIDITRLMPITYAVVMFLVFFGLGALYLDIANPLNF